MGGLAFVVVSLNDPVHSLDRRSSRRFVFCTRVRQLGPANLGSCQVEVLIGVSGSSFRRAAAGRRDDYHPFGELLTDVRTAGTRFGVAGQQDRCLGLNGVEDETNCDVDVGLFLFRDFRGARRSPGSAIDEPNRSLRRSRARHEL